MRRLEAKRTDVWVLDAGCLMVGRLLAWVRSWEGEGEGEGDGAHRLSPGHRCSARHSDLNCRPLAGTPSLLRCDLPSMGFACSRQTCQARVWPLQRPYRAAFSILYSFLFFFILFFRAWLPIVTGSPLPPPASK